MSACTATENRRLPNGEWKPGLCQRPATKRVMTRGQVLWFCPSHYMPVWEQDDEMTVEPVESNQGALL